MRVQIPLSGANSIVGRAVVVHELQDDLGKGDHSQPGTQGKTSKTTGNAGAQAAPAGVQCCSADAFLRPRRRAPGLRRDRHEERCVSAAAVVARGAARQGKVCVKSNSLRPPHSVRNSTRVPQRSTGRAQREHAAAARACPESSAARARRVGAMSFFDLCVAVLLFFNAAAILNEHRFLAKRACPALAAAGHARSRGPGCTRCASLRLRALLRRRTRAQAAGTCKTSAHPGAPTR